MNHQKPLSQNEIEFLRQFAQKEIKSNPHFQSKHQVSQSNNISGFTHKTDPSNPFGVKLKAPQISHEAPVSSVTSKKITQEPKNNPLGGKKLVDKGNDLVPESMRKKVQEDEDKLLYNFMGSSLVKEMTNQKIDKLPFEKNIKPMTKAETVANVNQSKNVFKEMIEKDKNKHTTQNEQNKNKIINPDTNQKIVNKNQQTLDRFKNKNTVHQQNAFVSQKPQEIKQNLIVNEEIKSKLKDTTDKSKPILEIKQEKKPLQAQELNEIKCEKSIVKEEHKIISQNNPPQLSTSKVHEILNKIEPKKENAISNSINKKINLSKNSEPLQSKPIVQIIKNSEQQKEVPSEIKKVQNIPPTNKVDPKKLENKTPDIHQSEVKIGPIENTQKKNLEKQMTLQNVAHPQSFPKPDNQKPKNSSPTNANGKRDINSLIKTLASNMEERDKPKSSVPEELQREIKVVQTDNMKNLLNQMNAHFEAPKEEAPVTVVSGTGPNIPSIPTGPALSGGPGVPPPPPMLPNSQVIKVPPKKIIPPKEKKIEPPKKKTPEGPSLMEQLKMVQLKKNK